MDKQILRIFQNEVLKQCEFAINSIQNINHTLNDLSGPNASSQFWYFVQNFLVSTANVSKLLWGSKKKSISEARKPLRESLNIQENSFKEIRECRNHFEHFDERIENWATSSKRRNFADSNIGPTNMIMGLDPGDFLRNFNTDTMSITFQDNTYEVQPIVDELVKIYNIAKEKVNNPF